MATADWFILMTVVVITVSGEPDPCLTSTIWTDGDGRSINCHVMYDKCDRYMEPGWYRVQSESGQNLTMPTSPVPVKSCGTKYPIWLNGLHPSLSDDIVDRVACVATYNSTCDHSYQIRIKNCQDFMAYYLIKAKGCNERYCFGDTYKCKTITKEQNKTPNSGLFQGSAAFQNEMEMRKHKKKWGALDKDRSGLSDPVLPVAMAVAVIFIIVLAVVMVLYIKRYKSKNKVQDQNHLYKI